MGLVGYVDRDNTIITDREHMGGIDNWFSSLSLTRDNQVNKINVSKPKIRNVIPIEKKGILMNERKLIPNTLYEIRGVSNIRFSYNKNDLKNIKVVIKKNKKEIFKEIQNKNNEIYLSRLIGNNCAKLFDVYINDEVYNFKLYTSPFDLDIKDIISGKYYSEFFFGWIKENTCTNQQAIQITKLNILECKSLQRFIRYFTENNETIETKEFILLYNALGYEYNENVEIEKIMSQEEWKCLLKLLKCETLDISEIDNLKKSNESWLIKEIYYLLHNDISNYKVTKRYSNPYGLFCYIIQMLEFISTEFNSWDNLVRNSRFIRKIVNELSIYSEIPLVILFLDIYNALILHGSINATTYELLVNTSPVISLLFARSRKDNVRVIENGLKIFQDSVLLKKELLKLDRKKASKYLQKEEIIKELNYENRLFKYSRQFIQDFPMNDELKVHDISVDNAVGIELFCNGSTLLLDCGSYIDYDHKKIEIDLKHEVDYLAFSNLNMSNYGMIQSGSIAKKTIVNSEHLDSGLIPNNIDMKTCEINKWSVLEKELKIKFIPTNSDPYETSILVNWMDLNILYINSISNETLDTFAELEETLQNIDYLIIKNEMSFYLKEDFKKCLDNLNKSIVVPLEKETDVFVLLYSLIEMNVKHPIYLTDGIYKVAQKYLSLFTELNIHKYDADSIRKGICIIEPKYGDLFKKDSYIICMPDLEVLSSYVNNDSMYLEIIKQLQPKVLSFVGSIQPTDNLLKQVKEYFEEDIVIKNVKEKKKIFSLEED